MPTKIEWADETWNPIIGCSRISPGCDRCYAIGVVHRGMSPQHIGLTTKPEGERVDWTGEVRLVEHKLGEPLRWTRPRRVFTNSLSDLFHENVSMETVARVFAMMALCPQHTFQTLTKRSKRMAAILGDPDFRWRVRDLAYYQYHQDMAGGKHPAWKRTLAGNPWLRLRSTPDEMPWPLPNLWLGVSIENDRYTFRANHLRSCPAAVRWISAEPLLGPLPSLDLTDIGWIVVGGESGPGAHPMHPDWATGLRDRCTGHRVAVSDVLDGEPRNDLPGWDEWDPSDGPFTVAAPIPYLFKQFGNWAPTDERGRGVICMEPDGSSRRAADALPSPRSVFMKNVGKNAAGRELDGRTWDQYPAERTEVHS